MNNDDFDVVIVGSGFGGSVMAYRLSKAGYKVCLLERGQAYAPGQFARTPAQLKQSFWDPKNGLYGLYDYWGFKGMDAIVSSGLAGGSLIYANVFLEKERDSFTDWPIDYQNIKEHYSEVRQMVGVAKYPFEERTPK